MTTRDRPPAGGEGAWPTAGGCCAAGDAVRSRRPSRGTARRLAARRHRHGPYTGPRRTRRLARQRRRRPDRRRSQGESAEQHKDRDLLPGRRVLGRRLDGWRSWSSGALNSRAHRPAGQVGAISKLRSGSYFPDWLLERRRRAERALTAVVATCYLLGVSTRRMEELVESLGITRLSKSQVSEMAKDLDAHGADFGAAHRMPALHVPARRRPGAQGARERPGGQRAHALVATGVNADRHREILRPAGHLRRVRRRLAGLLPRPDRPRPERDCPGHLRRPPRADRGDRARCRLAEVSHPLRGELVGGDPEGVLAGVPPGSAQRDRCPAAHEPWSGAAVRRGPRGPAARRRWVWALLHSVYDQPDAASVHAHFDRVLDALADKLPKVAEHLEAARADVLAFTAFPKGDLPADLVQQPQRAAQPRDPPAHRCRRHFPDRDCLSASLAPYSPSYTTNGTKAAATSPRRPRPLPPPTGHRQRRHHPGGDHRDYNPGAQRLTSTKITRQPSHTTPADLTRCRLLLGMITASSARTSVHARTRPALEGPLRARSSYAASRCRLPATPCADDLHQAGGGPPAGCEDCRGHEQRHRYTDDRSRHGLPFVEGIRTGQDDASCSLG